MRVRISYTVSVTDQERAAIAAELDLHEVQLQAGSWKRAPRRLATHAEVQTYFEAYGRASEGTINDWLAILDEEAAQLTS